METDSRRQGDREGVRKGEKETRETGRERDGQ